MNSQDNICAIATAPGGAIGIIRVSGSDAVNIANKVFRPAANGGKPLAERDANTVSFGRIVSDSGEVIDEVLVSIFRAPHSYTGEDSVEISCHGSQYILQQVMQLLMENGCRQAGPGEYTQRAFLNGKMDLSQAEAVADLISSSSAAAHRMAMSQMRGEFSHRLSLLREKLLKLTSLMELELDFSDHEELEFADRTELGTLTGEIEQVIDRLVRSFSLGNAVKNGVPVAIVGETNAGKSTLLNAIVGEERAIVSDIHGTTRDVIEDTVNIDGIVFRFIDTAGIRDTRDQIESLGIERTFKKIKEARIVVWLIDASSASASTSLAEKLLPLCKGKTLIVAYNKIDLIDSRPQSAKCRELGDTVNRIIRSVGQGENNLMQTEQTVLSPSAINPEVNENPLFSIFHVYISAKTNKGITALKELFAKAIIPSEEFPDNIIVSNLRHYEALTRALAAIHRVQDGLATQLPTDLVSQDLRDCLAALADITGGAITTQETLSNIFSHFCVGK